MVNGIMMLANSVTSMPMFSAVTTPWAPAGDVMKHTAPAMAIAAITSGTAPMAANTSGAMTIVLPADRPAMYVAHACTITNTAASTANLPFSSFSHRSTSDLKPPALPAIAAAAAYMMGATLPNMVPRPSVTASPMPPTAIPPMIMATMPPTSPANSMCFFSTKSAIMTTRGIRLKTSSISSPSHSMGLRRDAPTVGAASRRPEEPGA